jgi:hypothetical protein
MQYTTYEAKYASRPLSLSPIAAIHYHRLLVSTRVVPEVPDLTKKKNILEKNVFISLHSLLLARYTFPSDVQ